MLTLILAGVCSRNVCHGQGQENEEATVLLWDTKDQIRKESFFCTVQQWEQGLKKTSGPAQRLLDLIDRKGLAALG